MRVLILAALFVWGCVGADYRAGGKLNPCPDNPLDCPAGHRCDHGYCTPLTATASDAGELADVAAGTLDAGQPAGDVGPAVPRDCQAIKAGNLSATNGTYTIDPDGPQGEPSHAAVCDMTTAGGGWTRVVNLARGEPTWNAWSELVNVSESAGDARYVTTGLGMSRFSDTADGEDLEFLFVVDREQRGDLYRGVNKRAWDPRMDASEFDTGFEFRALDQAQWQVCNDGLQHANAEWNWSIASEPSGDCNGRGGGNGFLLSGDEESNSEAGEKLWGLQSFYGAARWISMGIYTRRSVR